MSKFRPQIKGFPLTPIDPVPAQPPIQPEVSELANRQQREIEELRKLSGIGVDPVIAPERAGIAWLRIANLVATLVCLLFVTIVWNRLNVVGDSLRESKTAYESAIRAARDAETAARAAESTVKSMESRIAKASEQTNEHTIARKRAVQKRK